MAGLAIPKGMPRKPFCITKRLIHYLLVFKIALGQGWVKQTGWNWEISLWPYPPRHKLLLKPGEVPGDQHLSRDLDLYPFRIPSPVPNACFSVLSRPALYMRDGLETWVQLGTPSPVSLNNAAYQGRDFKRALLIWKN